MQEPYLFVDDLSSPPKDLLLDEDQSRHAIQVLRMQMGDTVQLTDGKGHLCFARIMVHNKKACQVRIERETYVPPPEKKVRIAISLLKNPGRFEWFLEKATEIGVSEILPLLCQRTTRTHVRGARMQQVVISALIQSRQAWMPVLHEPLAFARIGDAAKENEYRWIAHCLPGQKQTPNVSTSRSPSSSLILIGPEGDFTEEEIALAEAAGFLPVSLGDSRLRTETAGIAAAALMCIGS